MAKIRDLALWALVAGLLILGFVHGYRNSQEHREARPAQSAPR
jgi:hypothetical protein